MDKYFTILEKITIVHKMQKSQKKMFVCVEICNIKYFK